MSTAVQTTPKPRDVLSLSPINGSRGPAPEGENDLSYLDAHEDSTPTINDVKSLKCGIVKTSQNKAYTILLVGETGVGKSSVFELIANVLAGNGIDHYNFDIVDHTNEQGGSNNQARLYELTSNNGIVVRILDTPGFTEIRNLQEAEIHTLRESIATQIREHTDSVAAVLIVANGTVPRVTAGTKHALSTLSTIFPHSPAENIAFMLTNVSGRLYRNFSPPTALADTPQFLLNNPVALQRKYLELTNDPNMREQRMDWRNAVKDGEENALNMLVELFDWLDRRGPPPTMEIFPLYQGPQDGETATAGTHAPVDQAEPRKQRNPPHSGATRILSSLGIGGERFTQNWNRATRA